MMVKRGRGRPPGSKAKQYVTAKSERLRRNNMLKSMLSKPICRQIVDCVAEKKYLIVSLNAANVGYAGRVDKITAVPQGDTDSSRDGDSLTIRSIELHWEALASTSGGTDVYNAVRLLVFQWFPSDSAAAPTVSSLLGFQNDPKIVLSPWAHDNRYNFKVLYDKSVVVTKRDSTTYNSNSYFISKKIRFYAKDLKSSKIQYEGGATTGMNNIYILSVSNSSAGTSNPPLISWVAKVNYTDA